MKVFLEEAGRVEVLRAIEDAVMAGTSRLAYVECRAAFARARREDRLAPKDERAASRALDDRWSQLAVVELDDALAREAATLADGQALRAADAIHLASAFSLAAGDPREMGFACWDAKLWDAASRLGFAMTPESTPSTSEVMDLK